MSSPEKKPRIHPITLNGLAIVGFITLAVAGMWLAVYSARYVPNTVGRIGAAAISLSQVFAPEQTLSSLSIVQTATTTIPFGGATTTVSTTTVLTPVQKKPVAVVPTAGKRTSDAYRMNGATSTPVLYGLPDLVVNISAIGYLATTSANSFVASPTVPSGSRPAIKFTIKNIGTNATGEWRFSASIPTQTTYIYQSQLQQSLNPGDSIDYTLGFDQAKTGANETVSVTANFDHAVIESNMNNDSASAKLTIL